eukprot:Platyproteum_vivax@DN12374_c0_g1_i1.p1
MNAPSTDICEQFQKLRFFMRRIGYPPFSMALVLDKICARGVLLEAFQHDFTTDMQRIEFLNGLISADTKLLPMGMHIAEVSEAEVKVQRCVFPPVPITHNISDNMTTPPSAMTISPSSVNGSPDRINPVDRDNNGSPDRVNSPIQDRVKGSPHKVNNSVDRVQDRVPDRNSPLPDRVVNGSVDRVMNVQDRVKKRPVERPDDQRRKRSRVEERRSSRRLQDSAKRTGDGKKEGDGGAKRSDGDGGKKTEDSIKKSEDVKKTVEKIAVDKNRKVKEEPVPKTIEKKKKKKK